MAQQPQVPPIRTPIAERIGNGAAAVKDAADRGQAAAVGRDTVPLTATREYWLYLEGLDKLLTIIQQQIETLKQNAVQGAAGLLRADVVPKVGTPGSLVESGIVDNGAQVTMNARKLGVGEPNPQTSVQTSGAFASTGMDTAAPAVPFVRLAFDSANTEADFLAYDPGAAALTRMLVRALPVVFTGNNPSDSTIVAINKPAPYNNSNFPFQVCVGANLNWMFGQIAGVAYLWCVNDATNAYSPIHLEASKIMLMQGNVGIGCDPFGKFQVRPVAGAHNLIVDDGVAIPGAINLSATDNSLNPIPIEIRASRYYPTFLPNTNPGAGGGLWYDPADGNRVKFAL
jgi:hypothetical protein